MSRLNLVDLMKLCGFSPAGRRVKIARNQDKRISVSALYETGEFDTYKRYQTKPNVFDCDYIVSCLGMPSLLAKMIGVYEVNGKQRNSSFPSNLSPELARLMQGPHDCYNLQKLDGNSYRDLEELYGRVVVQWPNDPINWCKKLTEQMTVVQVLPPQYAADFPGYLKLELPYEQLKVVIENHSAYKEWHLMLKAVKGIYLVFDSKEKKSYVGATYRDGGVLGRWRDYARTGYADSTQLESIVKADSSRARHFVFSILHTFPLTARTDEILEWEIIWKRKLRARDIDIGYCSN